MFRSDLIQAINRAEEFDVATGLPVSKLAAKESHPVATPSWLEFCTGYVATRWNEVAGFTGMASVRSARSAAS